MAIDPLSEVYSGRDNSGDAYIIPSTRRTAVDTFYMEAQKAAAQKAANKKALDEAYAKMDDLGNVQAWERDVPYLQKKRNEYTTFLANMYKSGVDPRSNPDVWKKATDMRDELKMSMLVSAQDKERFNTWDKETLMNHDRYTDDSRPNLMKWGELELPTRANSSDLGIRPYDEHNYIEDFNKTTAGANWSKESASVNMDQANGDSPYVTKYKSVVFDKDRAQKSIETWIENGDSRKVKQLYNDVVDGFKMHGVDPTAEQIKQAMVETMLPIAQQRTGTKRESDISFKPQAYGAGGAGASDGNDRFSWGVQVSKNPMFDQEASNDPVVKAMMKASGGKIPMNMESASQFLKNLDPKYVPEVKKWILQHQADGIPLKTWSIKDNAYGDNTNQTWTYTDANGLPQTVNGKLLGADMRIVNDGTGLKTKYFASIMTPESIDSDGEKIPAKTVTLPYKDLQVQIEAYSRGTKQKPGFDLDRLDPSWSVNEKGSGTATAPAATTPAPAATQKAAAPASTKQKTAAKIKNIFDSTHKAKK